MNSFLSLVPCPSNYPTSIIQLCQSKNMLDQGVYHSPKKIGQDFQANKGVPRDFRDLENKQSQTKDLCKISLKAYERVLRYLGYDTPRLVSDLKPAA